MPVGAGAFNGRDTPVLALPGTIVIGGGCDDLTMLFFGPVGSGSVATAGTSAEAAFPISAACGHGTDGHRGRGERCGQQGGGGQRGNFGTGYDLSPQKPQRKQPPEATSDQRGSCNGNNRPTSIARPASPGAPSGSRLAGGSVQSRGSGTDLEGVIERSDGRRAPPGSHAGCRRARRTPRPLPGRIIQSYRPVGRDKGPSDSP